MNRTIIKGPDFHAVLEDDILVEYIRKEPGNQYGDILLGTVGRIMSGPECAFVNIGRKHAGFLPLKENSMTFSGEPLRSGMKIAVQIHREETGGKGAYLTRDISIPGQSVILMPCNRFIGVSSRIKDDGIREKLRKQGSILAAGKNGIVMRQAAMNTAAERMEAEYRKLLEEWKETEGLIHAGGADGTVVYHADPVRQMISEYEGKGPLEIRETQKLDESITRQLQQADNRKIIVRNGGNIVIDRCEAMTVIDVNTGAAPAGGSSASVFLETNLDACESIVTQIRLRDLSGIIIIDFIDMESNDARNAVVKKLLEMLARDRRKTVLHGWTKLGLMEMTRKRTGN